MKRLILMTIISLTAAGAQQDCKEINQCLELVSEMTNTQYSYDQKLKGEIFNTKNFQLTKENADSQLSLWLHQAGYARIPLEAKNSYSVINGRDIRYSSLPVYGIADQLPHNHDYIMVTLVTKHLLSNTVARNFRPFLSRYGRIVDIDSSKKIIIADTAVNIRKLKRLLQSLDQPLGPEEANQREKTEKHERQLELLRAANSSGHHREIP